MRLVEASMHKGVSGSDVEDVKDRVDLILENMTTGAYQPFDVSTPDWSDTVVER